MRPDLALPECDQYEHNRDDREAQMADRSLFGQQVVGLRLTGNEAGKGEEK